MKNIIQALEKEHEHIASEIAYLKVFQDTEGYRARLKDFMKFATAHHEHEERDLFPWLATQPWLNQGGPKCSFFMGLRLEFAPLESLYGVLKEVLLKFPNISFTETHSPEWLQPSSPLSIPMEEHTLGHQFREAILYLLEQAPQEFSSKTGYGSRLVGAYLNLLEMHMKKENECLFVLCKQMLA